MTGFARGFLQTLQYPFSALVAYLLLIVALVGLDQSTKFHAESAFLTWTHPTQVLGYRADRHRVLTLGLSPSFAQEATLGTGLTSKSWADLNFTYVRNPGAAWGTFSRLSSSQRRALFYGVTLIVTVVIALLWYNSDPRQHVLRVGLCFLLGGAAGNFVDRLLLGYVIDWIHLHWCIGSWQVSFPVFNVADVAVHVGLVSLVADMLMASLRKENSV